MSEWWMNEWINYETIEGWVSRLRSFNSFISSIPFFENGWNWLKWRELTSWEALGGLSINEINWMEPRWASEPTNSISFSIWLMALNQSNEKKCVCWGREAPQQQPQSKRPTINFLFFTKEKERLICLACFGWLSCCPFANSIYLFFFFDEERKEMEWRCWFAGQPAGISFNPFTAFIAFIQFFTFIIGRSRPNFFIKLSSSLLLSFSSFSFIQSITNVSEWLNEKRR